MHDNKAYNAKLRGNAHSLRNDMTKAEASLWKYVLKARKMKGHQFRRQRPVLNYIADFMCKELDLIIEVDGMSHQMGENAERDVKRQQDIEDAGFTILRFTNENVLKHIESVRSSIENWIEQKESAL